MSKYKRLTSTEKKMNIKIRNELRSKGVIPPIKPKLNRKKFAKEVVEGYKQNLDRYDDIKYLYQAITWMIPGTKYTRKISSEQIGVLKVLKIAMEIKEFIKNNEETYKVEELYENVIEPIIKL